MSAIFRAADAALLARLEDRERFEALFLRLGGRPPAPARGEGLLAALREAGGEDELEALVRRVRDPGAALFGRLAHHLALLWARLARDAKEESDALVAEERALGLWLWLGAEGAYLTTLAAQVTGTAAGDETASRLALARVDALGARARAGLRERRPDARRAYRTLARVDALGERWGLPEAQRRAARDRAARGREAALEAAAAPTLEALEEASQRDAPAHELTGLLAEAASLWRDADRPELLERELVERVTPLAWPRCKAQRWGELRLLLDAVKAPAEHLAARLEGDPSRLAYAAPVAQLYVFRAEAARRLDEQLALAERAVALCPTHRNGRLILADALVERALGRLAAPGWDGLARAAEEVRRAESLFPRLSRLPRVKAALRARGQDPDD